MRDTLPEGVRALLHDRITSYEELSILLFLRRERGTVRTAHAISASLGLPLTLAVAALASLQTQQLVASASGGAGPYYEYAPASPALDEIVGSLASSYDSRPLEIVKLMSENALERIRRRALRAFADAFVLRKGKDDG